MNRIIFKLGFLRFCYLFLIPLSALDYLLTYIGLNRGFQEANPLSTIFSFNNPHLLVGAFLLVSLIILLCIFLRFDAERIEEYNTYSDLMVFLVIGWKLNAVISWMGVLW